MCTLYFYGNATSLNTAGISTDNDHILCASKTQGDFTVGYIIIIVGGTAALYIKKKLLKDVFNSCFMSNVL